MGTPNVLGISKLAISTHLRYILMKKTDDENKHLADELNDFFRTTKRGNTEFLIHAIDKPNNSCTPLSVFTFSVRLTDLKLLVHPQIVSMILLNAYGVQIRAGSQCAEACIRNLSIWEDLKYVDLSETPILQPSVCRLSIPRYLLSRVLVDEIKEKFTDFLSSVRLFLPCFEPSPASWDFRPEFLCSVNNSRTTIEEGEQKTSRGCSKCPGTFTYKPFDKLNPEDPNRKRINYGLILFSKISSSSIEYFDNENFVRDSVNNKIEEHPFRWFAVRNDLRRGDL
jgi:hypothetical protein